MLKCRQLEQSETIRKLRDEYLRTLVAPADGMWEKAVIAQAAFWEIHDGKQVLGAFCLDAEGTLLRVQLLEPYLERGEEILIWLVSRQGIQRAIASTIEPLYFSLCLDLHINITPHSYLFRDQQRIEPPADHDPHHFRKATSDELDALVLFYKENTSGPGAWIEGFLQERLRSEELFLLFDHQTLVATGECIPSQEQPPYADLGMVVAQAYRGRGLGSSMLLRLKQHCYASGWRPICSCEATNAASKRAIEKAGFVSEHRIVNIQF
ncbi:GNAT family N-acetyltransferase [Dictyobacter aurantiacus]|uniref:N-acetyltransferase domain-containing protein n=1 Tax=Dictyobacter aurantiacus TaxID=1936993 RepID=A0A401ZJW7_9CHLR|nr:GNAT family N-acetyltransferase [Dictyobacter aurantiacus]GCE07146.1 hypothetical protein KDAU_44750 [Dictyobacter aurantiacus]